MMFTPVLHNMLVEAGQHSIRARGSNGRATARHNEALKDLDDAIWRLMGAAPHMFRDEAWAEMEKKIREACK